MKKLFIHIGMPKCGSTTLQEFCTANREILYNKGYLYPAALNGWPQHAELVPNFHSLVGSKNSVLPHAYYLQSFENTECHTLCLSSEAFCFDNMSVCDFLSQKYDTTYIVYFRSPLTFAQSAILQDIRTYNFDLYSSGRQLFPTQKMVDHVNWQLSFLDNFCGGDFSSANFVVKNFDLCVRNECFEEDFCTTLGITDTQGLRKIPRQNVSLKIDYAFFYAHCNMLPLSRNELWKIEGELHTLSVVDSHARKYRLFSKKQIASVPKDTIDRYNAIGTRMGDPNFWQRGVDALLKLEECPYRQLPEDKQWEIFEKLSPESQQNIRQVWPEVEVFPGMVRRTGFLPDIPEDEKTAYLMRRWAMAYGQLALRQSPQNSELEELIKAKQVLEAQLAEYAQKDSLHSCELVGVQQQCVQFAAQVQELQTLRTESQQADATIADLRKEIMNLRHSKSWAVTAPLRNVYGVLKNR